MNQSKIEEEVRKLLAEFDEIKAERDLLRKQLEDTIPKPTELVKSWEETFSGEGYFIGVSSQIEFRNNLNKYSCNINVFKTEAQVKSALAYAQLSHIVADANGDWVADYNRFNQDKFVVVVEKNKLVGRINGVYNHLPMESAEIRDTCLEKHRTLWEDFWMISK